MRFFIGVLLGRVLLFLIKKVTKKFLEKMLPHFRAQNDGQFRAQKDNF